MMNFRVIKQALFEAIVAAESGLWNTIGHQRQRSDVVQAKGFDRTVEVFYRSGDFPKSGSTNHGPKKHDPSFELALFVSSEAEGDLSILENSASTPAERQTAMAALKDAAGLVDASMDELIDYIYQTVMSAATRYLGLERGLFDVLYISEINKDQPHNEGDLVILTATMRVTCTTEENVTGITGTPAVSIDTDFSIKDDQGGNAGVKTNPAS